MTEERATVVVARLAMAAMRYSDGIAGAYAIPAAERVATVDRLQAEHAERVALEGVELARELGASAAMLAVADSSDIAGTIENVADERDAATVVVGNPGLGAARSKLLGSTSRRATRDARRPVVVVVGAPASGSPPS